MVAELARIDSSIAVWRPSIADLLRHFQASLRTMAPLAEDAKIPWREAEAYDEWDEIASAMYDVFVARPIAADTSISAQARPLAPYDLRLESYKQNSVIAIEQSRHSTLILNRLLAGEGDFSQCEALTVSPDLGQVVDEPVVRPFAEVDPLLVRRRLTGEADVLRTVTN